MRGLLPGRRSLARQRRCGKGCRQQRGTERLPDSMVSVPARVRAVRARHAASLVVLRRAARGPEMLMGVRGARHRFMPNRLVFPGGAVDRADLAAPSATPLAPGTRARLERSASPALAHGLGIAAARELEEETGLSLGAPPALDGLDYICRLVTPTDSPVRFNARFLVADAARARGVLAGSGELEGLRFYPAAEALALDLAEPTRLVIGRLLAWLAMGAAERAAEERVPVFRKDWRWE
ncbi:MAG: NUDIX domain-containing protein [Acetobacteraceae bacterium]|nr:NUDIX domain-containing protein [Acetobacteraceae bacterium]